jgi:hypothetical protein
MLTCIIKVASSPGQKEAPGMYKERIFLYSKIYILDIFQLNLVSATNGPFLTGTVSLHFGFDIPEHGMVE